jgi:hypothetical protein
MDEKNIFQQALNSFTFDVASGGAISHLADLGYTPREIQAMLDFPTPYERVQEAFWNDCLKKRMIVEDKAELGKRQEKVSYVTEYDSYGRKSFRRVVEYEEGDTPLSDVDSFRALSYTRDSFGSFASFLRVYCCADSDEHTKNAYVSCDFGVRMKRDAEEYEAFLKPLTEERRRYIEGIPWERKVVWHVLNRRMREIVATLYEQSAYHGTILLLDKKEKISF